jgi:DNA replication initiation complex subunit (GINS family)
MSVEDDYSFENISQIRQKERRKPLSQLPINFYERFAERLEKLKELFQEENQKDPTSLKSMMFADEVRKTKLIFDEIRRRRKRKIILLALSVTPQDSEPPSELLPIERELFNDIVMALKENQKAVEGIMGLDTYDEDEEVSLDQTEIKTEDLIVMEPVVEEMKERPEAETAALVQGEETDLAMVRVLGDIGSFMSPDKRSYNLRKEDILELPASIANILKEHKKAELYSA